MSEIKSTLELVMERTRNLKLSEDEKRAQAVAEYRSAVKGLIQRHRDRSLAPDRFKEELQRLQESSRVDDDGIVFDEIAGRVNLDEENRWTLDLLATIFEIDPSGIERIFDEYRKALHEAADKRAAEIRTELRDRHGISGTAVVPNLDADNVWAESRKHIEERYEPRLADLKRTLQH